MKTTTAWLACMLLLAPAVCAGAQDGKKLYCWNDHGRRVCGDALPPDAVDSARTEINAKNGMTVRTIDRSLTTSERSAEADANKAAMQQAESAAAQKRRDLAMVESYATEDDLRRAYGERITLVEESLKTSRLGMANLRSSLLTLLRQAAELELQSQAVGKVLAGNISSQHNDLLRQQAILQQQLTDRASLGSDLEQALQRYRSLKAAQPPTSG